MTKPSDPAIVVSIKLAQGLIDYLRQRPYAEVADLIAGLTKCPQAVFNEPQAKEPEA